MDDLTRNQVAEMLGVSPDSVSRWAEEGKIPFWITPGGQRRYRRADIEAIREIKQPTAPVAPEGAERAAS